MQIKTTLDYSPNFNPLKRDKKDIKFLIFHYTGMKKESEAIKRLTEIQSEVSSHYLIKNSGEIITLVPELYVAWHAGKSSWKNFNFLNKNSIGIEISNPGHQFRYKKFSKNQINSLLKLSKFLIKKYKISSDNILGHSDIAPDRKKDPGELFPWKFLAKNKISSWHTLEIKILKNFRNYKIDTKGKRLFLKNLFKIGYSKKKPKNMSKNRHLNFVIKAFQRRYRQELINGKIDEECLMISQNLINR
jgi:N-acetylmuramoyl-L-alanine amidase|tara:strand:+ start:796 stop:1533 length:738 start_codon:yes stop_codon:yes gene_type:complete